MSRSSEDKNAQLSDLMRVAVATVSFVEYELSNRQLTADHVQLILEIAAGSVRAKEQHVIRVNDWSPRI